MNMHPTTANEVVKLRSDEKVARGLAAYEASRGQGEEATAGAKRRGARLRERPWQSLSLSIGDTLIDVLDRKRSY